MNFESIRIIEELLPDLNTSSLSQPREINRAEKSITLKRNKSSGRKPEPLLQFSQDLSRRSINSQKDFHAIDPHALALCVFVRHISITCFNCIHMPNNKDQICVIHNLHALIPVNRKNYSLDSRTNYWSICVLSLSTRFGTRNLTIMILI